MNETGPFSTETEARAAARALGGEPRPGWSILSPGQRRAMLTAACEAAGVELGAYDEQVIGWLAGWEDETCAVVAGLIRRAAAQAAAELSCPECGQSFRIPGTGNMADALDVAGAHAAAHPGHLRSAAQVTEAPQGKDT